MKNVHKYVLPKLYKYFCQNNTIIINVAVVVVDAVVEAVLVIPRLLIMS